MVREIEIQLFGIQAKHPVEVDEIGRKIIQLCAAYSMLFIAIIEQYSLFTRSIPSYTNARLTENPSSSLDCDNNIISIKHNSVLTTYKLHSFISYLWRPFWSQPSHIIKTNQDLMGNFWRTRNIDLLHIEQQQMVLYIWIEIGQFYKIITSNYFIYGGHFEANLPALTQLIRLSKKIIKQTKYWCIIFWTSSNCNFHVDYRNWLFEMISLVNLDLCAVTTRYHAVTIFWCIQN